MAEIGGKIGRTGSNLNDQMEDLLTSEVFTACRYLRPETLLIPFLNQSINRDDSTLQILNAELISTVDYLFWSRLFSS